MRYIKVKSKSNKYKGFFNHVHEVHGSVHISDTINVHKHRFVTVSNISIPSGICDHVHEVVFRTDSSEEHFHEFKGRTSGAIPVGNRHVHYLEDVTSSSNDHTHNFILITLIDNPIGL